MKDVKAIFGDNCRRIRGLRGLTQEEVAERAGLSLSYISEVERGNSNPTLTTAEKLANGLDAHISEVLDFRLGEATSQEMRKRLLDALSTADNKTISGLYYALLRAFNR